MVIVSYTLFTSGHAMDNGLQIIMGWMQQPQLSVWVWVHRKPDLDSIVYIVIVVQVRT